MPKKCHCSLSSFSLIDTQKRLRDLNKISSVSSISAKVNKTKIKKIIILLLQKFDTHSYGGNLL